MEIGELVEGFESGLMEGSADSVLGVVEWAEGLLGVVQALQYRALARFLEVYPEEFAAVELAAAMGWSRRCAENRLARARVLQRRLPGAVDALENGVVDMAKVCALVELTSPLSDSDSVRVSALVLGSAEGKTLRQFRELVRRTVAEVDPRGAAERADTARAGRRVAVTPLEDGVTELFAILKSEDAVAVFDRIERKARKMSGGTIEQRRADALVELILGAAGAETVVHVTVPADTLLGDTDSPGELAGYGAIPAETARLIAENGTWRRILTDPISGTVLDYGHTRYTPPKSLRRHVIARDRTCRFPGCEYPAALCDLDHTRPYDNGGTTAAHNLGAYCRHHHRAKHRSGWRVSQPTPGEFRFTSPLGRTYTRSCAG